MSALPRKAQMSRAFDSRRLSAGAASRVRKLQTLDARCTKTFPRRPHRLIPLLHVPARQVGLFPTHNWRSCERLSNPTGRKKIGLRTSIGCAELQFSMDAWRSLSLRFWCSPSRRALRRMSPGIGRPGPSTWRASGRTTTSMYRGKRASMAKTRGIDSVMTKICREGA